MKKIAITQGQIRILYGSCNWLTGALNEALRVLSVSQSFHSPTTTYSTHFLSDSGKGNVERSRWKNEFIGQGCFFVRTKKG